MHKKTVWFSAVICAVLSNLSAQAAVNTLIFDVHLTSCDGGSCNKNFKQTYTFSDALGTKTDISSPGGPTQYSYAVFQNVQSTPTLGFPDIAIQFSFPDSYSSATAFSGNLTSAAGPYNSGLIFNTGASSFKNGVSSTYHAFIAGSVSAKTVEPVAYADAISRLKSIGTFSFSELANSFYTGPGGGIVLNQRVENIGTAVITSFNGAAITGAVPEPETYAMLLAGLGLMGAVARRKSKIC